VKPVYDALIESCSELLACADALAAELWVTKTWYGVLLKAPPSADFDLVALDLVDEAERVGSEGCLTLLSVLAVLDLGGGSAVAAAAAARRVAVRRAAVQPGDRPVAAPWLDQLGEVSLDQCHRHVDQYGEQVRVIYQFVYPEQAGRHVLAVTIDQTCAGALGGIEVVATPAELADFLLKLADDESGWRGGRPAERLETLPAAEAIGLLGTALAVHTDQGRARAALVPRLTTSDLALLPLLRQRGKMLAAGSDLTSDPAGSTADLVVNAVAQAWPGSRRAALVEEFLAARSKGLRGVESPGMIATRVVDLSVEAMGWPPDRIGPLSVARLVGEVLPRSVLAPDPMLVDLEVVVGEWLTWRLKALGLGLRERGRMHLVIREALQEFPARCRDRKIKPGHPYVADLSRAQASGVEMNLVLDRRLFAVPFPGKRGDGLVHLEAPSNGLSAGSTQVDDLDAARAAHRELITAIGLSTRGVRREEFPARVGVVQQLWDDEPGEVWAAAQRLTAGGLPRHRVIEALGRLWQRHGPADGGGLESGQVLPGAQGDAYLAALKAR